jgi:CDP-diacylglycerol--inositol 3-phosphatidyltransferase
MYSTTSQQTHHKSAEGNANRFFLVQLYYSSYPFFGYCCVGAEFTYITIYILVRMRAEEIGGGLLEMIKVAGEWFLYLAIPACVVKQIVNMSQLCSSCYAVAEYDAKTKNKSK